MSLHADEIEITEADHRVTPTDIRAAVDAAITQADAERGVVHIAKVRSLLPPWATGPQVGARINGHVRRGSLVWTGDYLPSGNAKTRNAQRPAKVYLLIKPLAEAGTR